MNFEQLVIAASARSIDLKAVAGNSSDLHGIARRRLPTRLERQQRMPVRETVEGNETRVARARGWTHAELAQALGGLRRMPTLAAFYSFEGDECGYAELHRGLMVQALNIATEEKWPLRVLGMSGREGYYIEQLTDLVLTQDKFRNLFVLVPGLFAAVMNVSEDVWSARLVGRFMRLVGEYEGWLGEARAHVNRRLRDEFARRQASQSLASAAVAQ